MNKIIKDDVVLKALGQINDPKERKIALAAYKRQTDVLEDLFIAGKYAAAVYLTDHTLTPHGIKKPKLKRARMQDHAALEAFSHAIWIANGRTYTQHHWHMKLIDATLEDKS